MMKDAQMIDAQEELNINYMYQKQQIRKSRSVRQINVLMTHTPIFY